MPPADTVTALDDRHNPAAITRASHASRVVSRTADAVLWIALTLTAAGTALFISISGRDQFRDPKEIVLAAGGLAMAAAVSIRAIFVPAETWKRLRNNWNTLCLVIGVIAWTAITTAASTNPALSVASLQRVLLCGAIIAGTLVITDCRHLPRLAAIFLLPAGVNVAVLFLQQAHIWDPLYSNPAQAQPSALVGNSNDVGAYLLAPAIVALALAFRSRRAWSAGIALFLGGGIVLSRSATAVVAYAVALLVMVWVSSSWRRAAVGAVAFVALLGIAFLLYKPLRDRAHTLREAAIHRDYNQLVSNRLTGAVTAIAMFRDHPLFGVGPGTYSWHYFDYKIAAEATYPLLRQSGDRVYMLGEAHSDHLQTLAVAGLPGFALLIISLVYVARAPFRRERVTPLSADTGPALAAGAAALMLAQFPLELAACTFSLMYAATLVVGIDAHDETD